MPPTKPHSRRTCVVSGSFPALSATLGAPSERTGSSCPSPWSDVRGGTTGAPPREYGSGTDRRTVEVEVPTTNPLAQPCRRCARASLPAPGVPAPPAAADAPA